MNWVNNELITKTLIFEYILHCNIFYIHGNNRIKKEGIYTINIGILFFNL